MSIKWHSLEGLIVQPQFSQHQTALLSGTKRRLFKRTHTPQTFHYALPPHLQNPELLPIQKRVKIASASPLPTIRTNPGNPGFYYEILENYTLSSTSSSAFKSCYTLGRCGRCGISTPGPNLSLVSTRKFARADP